MSHRYSLEPAGQSTGVCECCGHESRTVWGYVSSQQTAQCAYFVHWTRGKPDHYPNIDLLIEASDAMGHRSRVLVSWIYSSEHYAFMVVDSAARPVASTELCAHALSRSDVLADERLLAEARRVLDTICAHDERIRELLPNDAA